MPSDEGTLRAKSELGTDEIGARGKVRTLPYRLASRSAQADVHDHPQVSTMPISTESFAEAAMSAQPSSADRPPPKRKWDAQDEIDDMVQGIKKLRCHELKPKGSWELLDDMVWNEKEGRLYGKWSSNR